MSTKSDFDRVLLSLNRMLRQSLKDGGWGLHSYTLSCAVETVKRLKRKPKRATRAKRGGK